MMDNQEKYQGMKTRCELTSHVHAHNQKKKLDKKPPPEERTLEKVDNSRIRQEKVSGRLIRRVEL